MWLPWSPKSDNSSTKIQQQPTENPEAGPAEEDVRHLTAAWEELCQLSPGTYPLLGLGVSAIFCAGWIAHRGWGSLYSRKFKRIRRHYEVPDSFIREKRFMKGVPVKVSDGDGFLFYHTPGPFWRWPLKFRRIPPTSKAAEGKTIRMRMAGIDAPEMAKDRESEGQPFSIESRDWLRNQISEKTIYCQLLKREGLHGRMVVLAFLPPRFLPWLLPVARGTNLSEEILRQGWAFVYESQGEFPHPDKKKGYQELMNKAQEAKVGMWKKGTSLETPGQYKKRKKEGSIPDEVAEDGADASEEEESWLRKKLKNIWRRR